jgi:hypothetical protein
VGDHLADSGFLTSDHDDGQWNFKAVGDHYLMLASGPVIIMRGNGVLGKWVIISLMFGFLTSDQ